MSRLRRRSVGVQGFLAICLITIPAFGVGAENVVEAVPQQAEVSVTDEQVLIEVRIVFDDPTVGGGFELNYDPALLEFVDFTFESDPQMLFQTAPPAGSTSRPLVFGAGWLIFADPFGVVGERGLGVLRFRPVGPGEATLDLRSSSLTPGPFYPPSSGGPLNVDYLDAQITIVPESGFTSLAACGGLFLSWLGLSRKSRRGSFVRPLRP